MFKMKAGKYRLQVERETAGRLFVRVIHRAHGRMVWNQLPHDARLGECVRAAVRVLDGLRCGRTSVGQLDLIVVKVQEKMSLQTAVIDCRVATE